ncbi:MAG TPA: hypothetical protein VGO27_21840, partial [Candidatus Acidoferrum sp.]|nr:hypothetical protein [Candidatus Acidoferrum sp.]
MNLWTHRRTEIASNVARRRHRIVSIAAVVLVLLSSSGCGNALEDNGTHLAYALEKGTQQLRASAASELVVRYETLDTHDDPYYVEITP